MSVDEMYEVIEVCIKGGKPNPTKLAQITAALRAAEEMYKGYVILERQARQCGFLDSRDHEKLLQAWDVATKEEKI